MSKRTPAGRHPANVVSLVAGLIFCGIAFSWMLMTTGVLSTRDLPWIVPVLLMGAGITGVVASISRNKKGQRR
jgi:hypothetical protein